MPNNYDLNNADPGGLQISNNEWFLKVLEDLEVYILACETSLDNDDEDLPFGTLSNEDFCGCTPCYSREQLYFLAPRIIAAYKQGFISISDV